MSTNLIVGLAGITGKFGYLLASKLLENPNITLRGYARDPSKVSPSLTKSPRLQLFRGEGFDDATIKPFVTGCDVVVCTYSGSDELMIDGQKHLIDACEEARVPRYVASDWSLDYTKLQLGELFVKDPCFHVKNHLETKKVVKGVHIMVGGFMDGILSRFFGIWVPETKTLQYWGEGTEPWEVTSYENAAEFTAAIVADTSAVGVRYHLGDRKTVQELAETFQKVYGFTPKTERLGSLDDLKTLMHAKRAESPAEIYGYLPLFLSYYWINGTTYVGPDTDNHLYPEVKPETWEDFLGKRSLEQLSSA